MPKLDLAAIPLTNATGYPPHFAAAIKERWYRRLAPAAGLEDFGASHVLQNRSAAPCTFVAIGRSSDSACHSPDIDLHLFAGAGEQRRKDGSGF